MRTGLVSGSALSWQAFHPLFSPVGTLTKMAIPGLVPQTRSEYNSSFREAAASPRDRALSRVSDARARPGNTALSAMRCIPAMIELQHRTTPAPTV